MLVIGCSDLRERPVGVADTPDAHPLGSVSPDAPAPPDTRAGCDPRARFGVPEPVTELNTAYEESNIAVSADGLVAYLTARREGAGTASHIYITTRATPTGIFAAPTIAPDVNPPSGESFSPVLTADARTMFFTSNAVVPGSTGAHDLFVATRGDPRLAFAPPQPLANVSSPAEEYGVTSTPAGTQLLFDSNRTGVFHLYRAVGGAAGFAPPQLVSSLVDPTGTGEGSPLLTDDGLSLYYSTARAGSTHQGQNVWVARRASLADDFADASPVDELSSDATEYPVFLTADGCTIYLSSDRPGGRGDRDLWRAERPR